MTDLTSFTTAEQIRLQISDADVDGARDLASLLFIRGYMRDGWRDLPRVELAQYMTECLIPEAQWRRVCITLDLLCGYGRTLRGSDEVGVPQGRA